MKQAALYLKWRYQSGDSLLEVMLAIGLIGVAALSLVGLQLAALRIQQSSLRYAQAVQLVDAAAEALRAGFSVSHVQSEWQERAATLLPEARIKIVDQGENVQLITLYWHEAKRESYDNASAANCLSSNASGETQCVSIAVAH